MDNNIPVYLRVDFYNFDFKIVFFFVSGRVIPKNNPEGKQNHNVQEVHMQPFDDQNKIWGHMMIWCFKGDLENKKMFLLDI